MNKFWEDFDNFHLTFNNSEKSNIYESLKDAKTHVNGLTDGWYGFRSSLAEIMDEYGLNLSDSEKSYLKNVIKELDKIIYR